MQFRTGNYITSSRQAALLLSAKRCVQEQDIFENLVDESGETLDEQFMNLSKRYMKTNCACFTPNTGRIDDILRMVDEYQVDGVIDCSLMFCCLYDTEKLAVSEALRTKNIPVLSLETDYTDKDAEQLRTRIGAFVEMLNQVKWKKKINISAIIFSLTITHRA